MNEVRQCTRRNFLKGASLGAAGLAATGMFGCARRPLTQAPPAAPPATRRVRQRQAKAGAPHPSPSPMTPSPRRPTATC